MKTKQFLLLLRANQYLKEKALARARKASGVEIFAADKEDLFNKNRYFDGCLFCDEKDPLALIGAVKAENLEALGAVPLNDWTLVSANKSNVHFSLPSLSKETIENARNKYEMRLEFEEFKLPNAKFFLLQDESGLKLAIVKISFPLIIKPYFGEMAHLPPSHRLKVMS